MPSLATVRAANATYAASYIPTAVFIGGTSGIGQAMAELFAKQTKGRANVIIIGRNKAAAEKIIAGFPKPPTEEGVTIKHEFVACDASELKNVHATSQELLQSLDKINILVLCTGGLAFNPVETSEGLEFLMVLRYYARAKFIHELMPLLQNARAKGEDARVMSVLAAAKGGNVDMTDLGLTKKWSFLRMVVHSGTFNDIMVKVLAEQYPDITFIHTFPGYVDTPAYGFHWTIKLIYPIMKLFFVTPANCAENMMYPLHSPDFAQGWFLLNERAEKQKLGANVTDDMAKKVWEHTIEVAKLQ